jgi:hypothetical protein
MYCTCRQVHSIMSCDLNDAEMIVHRYIFRSHLKPASEIVKSSACE